MNSTTTLSYIVITGAIIYAFTMPVMGDLGRLMDQKAVYQEAIAAATEIEEKKNTLLADFNRISAADIDRVETLIPNSLNFVKLVADIDTVASRHGISVNSVSYNDNSLDVASLAEAEAQVIDNYKSATISFEFISSYERFNDFLNDLERSLRILDVKSVQISTGVNATYNYQVAFDTYWSP